MKKVGSRSLFILIAFALTGLILFAGDSGKPVWGDEKTGFSLRYRLDNGQELKYEVTNKSDELMEMQGQKQGSETNISITYTLVGGQADDPEKLSGRITIDDFTNTSIQTAMGETAEIERDASNVIGKSFNFVFTPLGKELDYSGIEDLTIDLGPMDGGERSVLEHFVDTLPDLSDKPVKVGESWTSKTESDVPMGSYSAKTTADTTSVIEGIETINGYECLRIHSKFQGVVEGSGTMMNFPFTLKGNISGEGPWYFAYKKGFSVKESSDYVLKMDIIVGSGENQVMTIPLNVKGTSERKLTSPVSQK